MLEGLAGLGVDYTDVVQVLQDEGVEKLDASWDEMAEKLAVTLHDCRSAQPHRTDGSREQT